MARRDYFVNLAANLFIVQVMYFHFVAARVATGPSPLERRTLSSHISLTPKIELTISDHKQLSRVEYGRVNIGVPLCFLVYSQKNQILRRPQSHFPKVVGAIGHGVFCLD
jgi:hypothetical protein